MGRGVVIQNKIYLIIYYIFVVVYPPPPPFFFWGGGGAANGTVGEGGWVGGVRQVF